MNGESNFLFYRSDKKLLSLYKVPGENFNTQKFKEKSSPKKKSFLFDIISSSLGQGTLSKDSITENWKRYRNISI